MAPRQDGGHRRQPGRATAQARRSRVRGCRKEVRAAQAAYPISHHRNRPPSPHRIRPDIETIAGPSHRYVDSCVARAARSDAAVFPPARVYTSKSAEQVGIPSTSASEKTNENHRRSSVSTFAAVVKKSTTADLFNTLRIFRPTSRRCIPKSGKQITQP